jgi:hypothetical protein
MFLIRKFFIWKKKQNFDLKILHHSNNSRFNEKDLNEMEQKLIDLVKTVEAKSSFNRCSNSI